MEKEITLSNKANEFIKLQKESIDIINSVGNKIHELSKNLQEFKKYGQLNITLDELLNQAKSVTDITSNVDRVLNEVSNIQLISIKLIETEKQFDEVIKNVTMLYTRMNEISEKAKEINVKPIYEVIEGIALNLTSLSSDFDLRTNLSLPNIEKQTNTINLAIDQIRDQVISNSSEISELKTIIKDQNILISEYIAVMNNGK